MQIFHWLSKVKQEEAAARDNSTSNSSANNRKCNKTNGKDGESRDIILYKNCGGAHRRSSKRVKASDESLDCCKYYLKKPFACFCRKDVAVACFYSTLNLTRVGNVDRRQQQQQQHWIYSMKMKKEELASSNYHKAADTVAHAAGNKVIPVRDFTLSSSSSSNANDHNKIVSRGGKTRTMSRMKELLRWAAAARSEKGGKFNGRKVLEFRNHRATQKAVPDDELIMESPKISLRWDHVESCFTASMASSSMINDQTTSCSTRKGNWITTDAEFVVLEL